MHVRVQVGNYLKNICGITLQGGYKPCIGCFLPRLAGSNKPLQLEPAIWFKAFMIEYININCDSRKVSFRKVAAVTESSGGDGSSRLKALSTNLIYEVYDDGEYYDFDSHMDELFDQAKVILIDYCNKKILETEFNLAIFKLLHCYILPSVKFTLEDLPLLLTIQENVFVEFLKLEEEIIKQDKKVFFTETSLHRQRERLFRVEDFHRESYVQTCKRDFLGLLLIYVEKDIRKLGKILEVSQEKINEMKDVEACLAEESEQLLAQRRERDEIYKEYEFLEVVRETVKNVIIRPAKVKKRKKKKIQTNVFHDVYTEVAKKVQQQKDVLHSLCLAKVKIATVREAVKTAIQEIESFGETLGMEIKADGSERATDILGLAEKPDGWLTLEEKVASVLGKTKTEPSHIHACFCCHVRDRIQATIAEQAMFQTSLDGAIAKPCKEINRVSIMGISAQMVQCETLEIDLLDCNLPHVSTQEAAITSVKNEIKSHIGYMCSKVLGPLLNCTQSLHGRLWITYENHVYHEIMTDLYQLYEQIYKPAYEQLNYFSQLSLGELIVQDPWLKELTLKSSQPSLNEKFHLNVDVQEREVKSPSDEVPEFPSVSKSCMDLGKCKMEDLYRIADEDCSDMMESFNDSIVNCNEDGVSSLDDLEDTDDETTIHESDVNLEMTDRDIISTYDLSAFHAYFLPAFRGIEKALVTTTILGKLKCLTRAFRFVSSTIAHLQSSGPKKYFSSSDDILTVFIIILMSLGKDQLKQLYVQILIMVDFMAPCLFGGIHDCCLTNFNGAFQYLFHQVNLEKNRAIRIN